jgi:hypothetical protein
MREFFQMADDIFCFIDVAIHKQYTQQVELDPTRHRNIFTLCCYGYTLAGFF